MATSLAIKDLSIMVIQGQPYLSRTRLIDMTGSNGIDALAGRSRLQMQMQMQMQVKISEGQGGQGRQEQGQERRTFIESISCSGHQESKSSVALILYIHAVLSRLYEVHWRQ